MARSCLTIILAAGEGTRMKSSLPKVLHKVAGLSMVGHVIHSVTKAGADKHALVIGNQAELVETEIRKITDAVEIFEQTERLGTGHAVLAAQKAIKEGFDDILVVFGDTPLTRPETLLRLRVKLEEGADVAVLGFYTQDPTGYGRLVEKDSTLIAIREHREATQEELKINFCNGGIMAISGKHAMELISAIDNNNNKGEYYLTDVVEIANGKNLQVVTSVADEEEVMGVNNRLELSKVEAIWQERRRAELMVEGVAMQIPQTIILNYDTEIDGDVVLEPNIVFGAGVKIEKGATIRAFSHLEETSVASDAIVGPYARLRPGTVVGEGAKIGNFVETKKAEIAPGAKVNHLTYIGDAVIGAKANIGAGTITCNYDGTNKHITEIGEGAFIGSNSSLVAPVKIGKNSYVGSGSVVTQDVPEDALAIARGKQQNLDGYATKIREKAAKLKAERQKSKS